MNFQQIGYSANDGVCTVTLNRPEKLNAWTATMEAEVSAAMQLASHDEAVRVIVLTGSGRGFCAGADMGMLEDITQDAGGKAATSVIGNAQLRADDDNFGRTYSYLAAVPKPVIAAINGPAAGLGLVIALYCDIRFSSDSAVFSTAFAKRGLIAEHGISWLLPRLVGMGNAADLLFSARKIDAAEAGRIGLVDRIIPHDRFRDEVMQYARMMAATTSPRSHREMKREIWNAQFQTLGEAIDAADRDMAQSFLSEDFREGVAHFVEKRPPDFTGR